MLNKILLKFVDKDFYHSLKEINNQQYFTIEDLKRIQELKFIKLIDYVKNSVPYYQTKLKDIQISSLADSINIPFLSKEIIRTSFNDLISSKIPSGRLKSDSTSGSTGEPIRFLLDKKFHKQRMAFGEFGDSFSGWELGEPRLIIWGAERDIKNSLSRRIAHSKFLFNTKIVSSYYLTDKDIDEFIKLINTFKPVLISGYPSTLEFISNYIHKKGGLLHSPRVIIIGGETLYDTQKSLMQEVFECKVLRRYGSREFGIIASECSEQLGLHIHTNRVFLEIINEKLKPVQPSELGEIIITDLDNYVFPFIRYRIGDIGNFSGNKCKCGRNTPLLKSIEGRTFDLILGTNGNRVPGNYFTLLRNKVNGMLKFQVIQNEIDRIDFKIVPNEEFDAEEKSKLITELKLKLGKEMKINIELVDKIDTTNTGKFRFVISKITV